MYWNGGKFSAFSEGDLRDDLNGNTINVQQEVGSESDDYILNVNEREYIEHLIEKYTFKPLLINFDDVSVSSEEKEIDADYFPSGYHVTYGHRYKKPVFIYHIPYSGNGVLFKRKPSTYIMWTTDVYLKDGFLNFELVGFSDDTGRIKQDAEDIIDKLKIQYGHIVKQIENYNNDLPKYVEDIFKKRKQAILKKNDMLASLGVPIRKRDDTPQTFSIPAPEVRRKIAVKPSVSSKGYKPEPTLDITIYQDILKMIHDFGKALERLPSTYLNKHEEEIRDHILIMLEPHYEGSTTGETFNKTGKTDILLRHDGTNVFIAECKFWEGKKHYFDTISQLLGYLTWRDSKAAVVIFVKNKELSPVIQTIKEETPNHSNFLGFVDESNESWLNYRFHIEGDKNREVKLAILWFHIPPV